MKKYISTKECLQLEGIAVLAKEYNKLISDLSVLAYEITGEEDDLGHTTDFIYSNLSVKELLNKLGIKVKK